MATRRSSKKGKLFFLNYFSLKKLLLTFFVIKILVIIFYFSSEIKHNPEPISVEINIPSKK